MMVQARRMGGNLSDNEHTSAFCSSWVELVIAKAGDLRAAGVMKLSVAGCSVDLSELYAEPKQPTEITEDDFDKAQREPADPLDDPVTFGYKGFIPGFSREKDK